MKTSNKLSYSKKHFFIENETLTGCKWENPYKPEEERANICARYDKKIEEAEREKKVMLYIFDSGISIDNVTYYDHTNKVVFNWKDYDKKISQEEFVDFINKVDYSQLPEGIEFEIK